MKLEMGTPFAEFSFNAILKMKLGVIVLFSLSFP
jgi:hypothetical protein